MKVSYNKADKLIGQIIKEITLYSVITKPIQFQVTTKTKMKLQSYNKSRTNQSFDKFPLGFYEPQPDIISNDYIHKITICFKNVRKKYDEEKIFTTLCHEFAHAIQLEKVYRNNLKVYNMANIFSNYNHELTAWKIGYNLLKFIDKSDKIGKINNKQKRLWYAHRNYSMKEHNNIWFTTRRTLNLTEQFKFATLKPNVKKAFKLK